MSTEIPRGKCSVCGASTQWLCSDCGIDTGGKWKIYVCNATACRDRHEAMANCRPAPPPLPGEEPDR